MGGGEGGMGTEQENDIEIEDQSSKPSAMLPYSCIVLPSLSPGFNAGVSILTAMWIAHTKGTVVDLGDDIPPALQRLHSEKRSLSRIIMTTTRIKRSNIGPERCLIM